ncbi:HprK-related kinase A [Bowmanella denitrificans]|uniref:HprK-related kinase A n=1 Tax=Bowmanella denitrificans TaxID=366582 RepID=UPI000C9CBC4B|nr:HprK-related kinase A [Bowmanella denitrificans]
MSRESAVFFRAGRFTASLTTSIPSVLAGIKQLYPISNRQDDFADFHIALKKRRWYSPQVLFSLNNRQPFSPLPYGQALPLLEWGLNWCVTQHYHQALVMHAAVVEKAGKALILPGSPGSGKSTLCAALVSAGGWRLFSDELALVALDTPWLEPNPRPISLKNRSIDIIKEFSCGQIFTESVKDTLKGTVAHMCPPQNATSQWQQGAEPALIIFPKYQQGVKSNLQPVSAGAAFMRLVENSFNYHILGAAGFRAMAGLMDKVRCFDYVYDGNLEHAIGQCDELVANV